MRNIINVSISMTIIILLLMGCSYNEIEYYSNPYILIPEETKDINEIEEYKLSIVDNMLRIDTKNNEFEIPLPENYRSIQSFHFSYDKRYLAYDLWLDGGNNIFVIDLETGEEINLSEKIGNKYNYDGYKPPFGIAWAPNKNLIAFIGGHTDAVRIDLYHFEMDTRKQAPVGSFAFNDIYGVKWDNKGESIYYVVDSAENENMFELYQTEIESDSYLLGGSIYVITELNEVDFNNWFNKEE